MASIFKSKYTGEQIEELLDKASTVSDVQANNGEPTTADLSTIKIGDVNYKIPEPPTPEDPTDVEANPSGEATAELTKLKVGETIYSIPRGSGGGGKGSTISVGYGVTLGRLYHADGSRDDSNYNNVIAFVITNTVTGGVYFNNAVLCLPPTGTPFFGYDVEEIASNTIVIPLGDSYELFAHDL